MDWGKYFLRVVELYGQLGIPLPEDLGEKNSKELRQLQTELIAQLGQSQKGESNYEGNNSTHSLSIL